jgi:hypothetical protein
LKFTSADGEWKGRSVLKSLLLKNEKEKKKKKKKQSNVKKKKKSLLFNCYLNINASRDQFLPSYFPLKSQFAQSITSIYR